MPQEEDIAKLLIDAVRARSPLSGADLGPLVKERYPAVDLKTEYGGLNRFIRTYCGQEIKFLGKRGVDNLYTHKDSQNTNAPLYTKEAEAWKAFSNPKVELVTIIDRHSGKIDVAPSSQTEFKDGWISLGKISPEEYRSMAEDFLTRLPPSSGKEQLQNTLKISDFWPRWSLTLNGLRAEGIFKDWLSFRIQHIADMFEQRLSQLDLSTEVLERARHSFKESRQPVVRQKADWVREPAKREYVDPRQPPGFRTVILQSLNSLSDEELRRIWLPVGVLLDVLKRSR
jgi:hypothetical protein